MIYAIMNPENKIVKIWHKLNHFTSSSWSKRFREGYKIIAFEPKILVEFPITENGIEQIRNFNNELPKKNGKKGKTTYRATPDNIVSGVI